MRLDTNSNFPSGMKEYLSVYGWHFNNKMCDFAVSKMTKSNNQNINRFNKDEIDNILKRNSIVIKNDIGYDKVFVANMCITDYYGSSVIDENRLAKFIKDYLDDPDGYDEVAFTRYYADCIAKGVIIPWEDVV
jgi:hypothetical protein